MKFYAVLNREEQPLAWATSQDRARQLVTDLGGPLEVSWEPIEVPTDKDGLLRWLNERGTVSPPVAAPIAETEKPAGEAAPLDIDAIEGAITDMNANQAARVAIAAFEQLTITGQPALDAIKAFLRRQPQHVYFSAGVHVLTALALSEIATDRRIQP